MRSGDDAAVAFEPRETVLNVDQASVQFRESSRPAGSSSSAWPALISAWLALISARRTSLTFVEAVGDVIQAVVVQQHAGEDGDEADSQRNGNSDRMFHFNLTR